VPSTPNTRGSRATESGPANTLASVPLARLSDAAVALAKYEQVPRRYELLLAVVLAVEREPVGA
jgi:hypothetical protein